MVDLGGLRWWALVDFGGLMCFKPPPSPPHRARAPPPLSRGPPETPPFRVPPLGACGAGGLALRPSPYSHPACAIPPPTCGVSGRAHAESVAGGALTG